MFPGYLGMGTCHNRMNDRFRESEEFSFDLEQCANACIDCHLNSNCGPVIEGAANFDDCGSWALNKAGGCYLMPPQTVLDEHSECFWHEHSGLDYHVYVNGVTPTYTALENQCSGLGCFEHTFPRQEGFYMLPGYHGMGTCHNRMNDRFRESEEFTFDLEQCANACIDCHLNGNCGPVRDEAANFDDCGSWELNGAGACFLMPPQTFLDEHSDCFWHEHSGLDYHVYVNGVTPTYTAVEGQQRRHLRIKDMEKKV